MVSLGDLLRQLLAGLDGRYQLEPEGAGERHMGISSPLPPCQLQAASSPEATGQKLPISASLAASSKSL